MRLAYLTECILHMSLNHILLKFDLFFLRNAQEYIKIVVTKVVFGVDV